MDYILIIIIIIMIYVLYKYYYNHFTLINGIFNKNNFNYESFKNHKILIENLIEDKNILLPINKLKINDLNNVTNLNLADKNNNILPSRSILPIYIEITNINDFMDNIIENTPKGFLYCDGNIYKIQQIKNNYGAVIDNIITITDKINDDEYTYIQTPDLRGKFLLGSGENEINKIGGEEGHRLQTNEILKHTHTVDTINSKNLAFTAGTFDKNLNTLTSNSTSKNILTEYNQGGQSHNNMPPYITIMYFMKI
jgi:microcystin-dependent protein